MEIGRDEGEELQQDGIVVDIEEPGNVDDNDKEILFAFVIVVYVNLC